MKKEYFTLLSVVIFGLSSITSVLIINKSEKQKVYLTSTVFGECRNFLVGEREHNDANIIKISRNQPFGPTWSLKEESLQLKGKTSLNLNLSVMTQDNEPKIDIAFVIFDALLGENDQVSYQSFLIEDNNQKLDTWTPVNHTFNLPENITDTYYYKLYFYNHKNIELLVKNLSFKTN